MRKNARRRRASNPDRRRPQEADGSGNDVNNTRATADDKNDPTLGAGTLTRAERHLLLTYYYNLDNVAALTSSASRLYAALKQQHPTLTLKKCRFFLQSQSPYTLTAPHRRSVPRNPMEVYRTFDMLACDIMILRQFAESTAPEQYCLLVVDVFSRYCWPLMLETRSADEITRKFERLLERLRPRLLRTTIFFDQERAILSRQFRAMLRKFDVHLQLSYTVSKVSHAEVLIRYLKRSLYRYALYSRDANLIDALHRIVATYNRRVHSALHGATPAEVLESPDAEWRLWEARFPHLVRGEPPPRAKVDRRRAPPIGSFVRVLKKRTDGRHFVKETDPTSTTFSNSIYQVIAYNLMFTR